LSQGGGGYVAALFVQSVTSMLTSPALAHGHY
jgi:hypothetical protein